MILASNATSKDIRQQVPDPEFLVESPRVNPLVPNAPLSITQGNLDLGIKWMSGMAGQSSPNDYGFVSRIVENSRQEVEKNPGSARALCNLGIALMNYGDLSSAIVELEKALAIDPNHFVAANSLARIKVENQDFEGAEVIYRNLMQHYPSSPGPSLCIAQIAMRRNDFEQAEHMFRQAIQLGHRGVTARFLLSMILLKLNRPRLAFKELRDAIKSEVRAPFLYQGLGIAYAVQGNLKRAIVAFKTALALAPMSAEVIQNLAQAYLASNETDLARELLREHLDRNPDEIHSRELLGMAYFRLGQFKSVISQLLQVHANLERMNGDLVWRARIANNIGVAYLGENSADQAEPWFKRSLELSADCGPLAYDNLARVYFSRDELPSALNILTKGQLRFPKHSDTIQLKAFAYRRAGMYKESCNTLLSLVQTGQAPITVYSDLGTLLTDEMRDPSQAVEVMLKGRELYPNDPLLLNNLAYAYLMGGQTANAIHLLHGNEGLISPDAPVPAETKAVLTATFGLLNLAMGDESLGEQYYRRAHKLAVQTGNRVLAQAVLQKMHLEIARACNRHGENQRARHHLRLGSTITGGMLAYEQDLQELSRHLLGEIS